MKRISTKTSKRIAIIILAAVSAFAVVGCSKDTTVTETETYTDENGNIVTTTSTQTVDKNGKVKNGTAEISIEPSENTELVTYDFETFDNVRVVMDENSIIAQEPSDDPEYSDLVSEEARGNIIAPGRDYVYLEDDNYYYVADIYRHLITVADKSKATANASYDDELPENPGSFETDEWSISYDTDEWYGYVNDEGNTIINYLGECAGTSLIEITDLDVATAGEAVKILEEKTGRKLTIVDAEDGADYTCMAYEAGIEYEKDKLYIDDFFTIYEHDGKVIVIDENITHDFDDDRAEALAEKFLEVKNALVIK